MTHYDSTGKVIKVGNTVCFRGQNYTIQNFIESKGACNTSQIEFVEEQHTTEIADEISVDLIC